MPRLKLALYQLERLVQIYLPDVYEDLLRKEIGCELFAVQWLVTLFSSDFDEKCLHVVWDLFLARGWKVIFQVALALLMVMQKQIAEVEYEDLICMLKNGIRENKLVQMLAIKNLLSFKVTNKQLLLLQEEYEAKNSFTQLHPNPQSHTIRPKPPKLIDYSIEDAADSPIKIQPIRSINTARNYTDKQAFNHIKEEKCYRGGGQPLKRKRLSKDSCNISTSTVNSPQKAMHGHKVLIRKGLKQLLKL